MLLGEQFSYSLYAKKTGFGPEAAIGPRAREKLKDRDRDADSELHNLLIQSWLSTVSGIQQHGTPGLRLKSPDLPGSLAV